MTDKTLVQFVRDRKGQPRGMVVATVIDNQIRIGWSYTNTKLGDRFNKSRALQIALGRVENGQSSNVKTPHSVSKVIAKMKNRATVFFKNVNHIEDNQSYDYVDGHNTYVCDIRHE